MGRGQITIDLLFAITLVTITMLSLVSFAVSERASATVLDTGAKLKVFSVELRDAVVKAYSGGGGFRLKKVSPIPLSAGDNITVSFDGNRNRIVIDASIGGRKYRVVQNSMIPFHENSTVVLTQNNTEFWVAVVYNQTEGLLHVRLEP
ncbi:hypothetical protein E3E36_06400 [Thermococcus sp. M36]|uniref:hypothetical protein n=1 Tax=Thermococcus sp. M36 TaxID=1638261 RepID=UPI00143BCEC7|nr:hypothetical protein [Thermococcus sp. M36]NJE05779.1 hypothetical protein [Thermococcus sp. M36]